MPSRKFLLNKFLVMSLYSKFFLLISVLLLLLCYDTFLLFRSSTAIGVDGYYYVIQVNSFLENGDIYFPSSTPIILYFLSSLSFISGDIVLGIKLGIIILEFFLYLGVFSLIKNLTKNFFIGSLEICFLSISGLHYFLSVSFLTV
jgi:hypothetical protein